MEPINSFKSFFESLTSLQWSIIRLVPEQRTFLEKYNTGQQYTGLDYVDTNWFTKQFCERNQNQILNEESCFKSLILEQLIYINPTPEQCTFLNKHNPEFLTNNLRLLGFNAGKTKKDLENFKEVSNKLGLSDRWIYGLYDMTSIGAKFVIYFTEQQITDLFRNESVSNKNMWKEHFVLTIYGFYIPRSDCLNDIYWFKLHKEKYDKSWTAMINNCNNH